MSIFRFFSKSSKRGKHHRKNEGRNRCGRSLLVERLEDRTVPTIVFAPQGGVEATTFGNGARLSNVPVELIFWGSGWANNSYAGPTRGEIEAAVATELASPIFNHLTQYGTDGHAFLDSTWTVTSDPNSNGFSDSDIHNAILSAINDPNSPILAPSSISSTPLYVVVTPPGERYSGNTGFNGFHTDFYGNTSPATKTWSTRGSGTD
jgi:hypothetical protein